MRVRVAVQSLFNVREVEGLQFLEGLLEHVVRAVFFAEGDDLARAYRIGRDVYALAVYVDEAVVDHLTGLTDGACETCAVHEVVQAGLEEEQQVRAGDAFHAVRFIVIAIELSFKDVVHRFDFLFLCELSAVFRLFLLTRVSGLPF